MSRDYYGGRGGSRRSRSRERGDDDRSQRPRERDSEGSSRNLSYGGEGDRGRSERGGGYGGSYGGGSDRAGGYGGSYGGGSDRVGGYGGSYGGGSDRGGGYGGGSDRAGGYGGGSDRGGGYGGGSGRGAGYGGTYGGGSDRGGGYGGGSDRGGGYGGGSDRGGGGSDRGSGYSGRGAGYGGASDRGSIYGPGGRGGRDGGFQGRGGGGGRGGKKSMADVQSLVRLIETSSDMSDNACLQIIEPSQQALQQRDGHMQNIEATNSKSKYFLPPADPWRTASRLGLMIDNAQHIVRANCFRMNPQYLPPKIFHYNIGIFRANKDGSLSSENDFAKDSRDESQNIGVVRAAIQLNPDWKVDKKLATVGLAYDGHSSLYTTSQLPIMNEVERSISTHNSFSSSDSDGYTAEVTWPSNSTSKFFVVIRLVSEISVPQTHDEWKNRRDVSALQALNVAISTFATWQSCETNPSWIMAKNKAFRSEGESYEFTSAYLGRLGYYYSLKACTSGLVLLSEVSVHCFLRGGKLIELMATIGGFRSVTDMYQSCNDPEYGLPRGLLLKLEETFKGYKVRLLHLQHRKSFKSFGPPSNHPDSEFEIEDGRKITVEQYYQQKAQEDGAYARALPRGQLQYPRFPTLNVGSKNKKILIPLELVEVIPGQSKSHGLPTEVSSNIIKLAAMVPKDRFRHLDEESKYNGLLYELQNNADEIAFGLSKIDSKPMKVSAFILPPPKLQYKNRLIEPQLKGSWNLVGGVAFKIPPPAPISQKYPYGVVVVHRGARPPAVDHNVQEFIREYERESNIVQVPMMLCEQVQYVEENINFLKGVMEHLQSRGARIVLVLLNCDAYAAVKFAADSISLPTQCVKWSNLVKPPRNYCTSLLVKINYKMGGVNHTLASRVPETSSYTKMDVDEQSFQSPPKSISWLFDEPCMMMGVDVALPEKGDSKSNILVSVVGSTDGMLGQYAAHVSICRSTDELVYSFERAMESILQAFCERNNGQSPRRILIYRAGMNENQFDQVLEKELVAFKRALDSRGYDSNYVKMAVVVGQKRHHSRFVYEEGSEAGSYLNPCVGLCIDSRSVGAGSGGTSDSSVGSITSPNMNEFYLNSHAAILGTSKTCRYTLIYDEIGLELIEIELLTFWTTHLYARCTKSISSATPIAYAYFASRRGRFLLKGGASSEEVAELSERWLSSEKPASLYFA